MVAGPEQIIVPPSSFSSTTAWSQDVAPSPGEINRRKVAEILARRQAWKDDNGGAGTTTAITSAEMHSLGPVSALKPETTQAENLTAKQTLLTQADQPAAPSPGEINRRKVAEILARRQAWNDDDRGAGTETASPSAEIRSLGPPSAMKSNVDNLEDRAPMKQTVVAPEADTRSAMENLRRRIAESANRPLRPVEPESREGWFAKGEAVNVRKFTISDGMVYVGGLSCQTLKFTNFLINPVWPITSHGDVTPPRLAYYPSYDRIEPQCRHTYLTWLADGKKEKLADIGYVFLYFYGLEHRIFGDGALNDAPVILAEVERLRGVYGVNHSFERYSREFRDVLALMANGVSDQPPPFDTIAKHYEQPLWLKLGIGKILAEDRPIPAEWMLAWYLSDPLSIQRTSVRRALPEFCTLFLARFRRQFPNGLKIAKPKGRLRCTYRLAANNQEATVSGTINEWPDIGRLQAPVTKAQEIADACMADVDAYSRYLGKNPEGRARLQAFALLPREAAGGHPAAEALASWLNGQTEAGAAAVEVAELCRRLEIEPTGGKLGRAQQRDLTALLARFGHGVEPDPLFGGPAPALDQPAVLFRLPDGGETGAPSPAYTAATSMLSLAALVVHADGRVLPEEERLLLRHAEDSLHLSPGERARLEAHALWLLRRPPSLAQVKAKLAAVDAAGREALARFALALAGADGHVCPQEIRLLERIYKLLELDPSRLFSDIHALAAGIDEPVTVLEAEAAPTGRPIPPPPAAEAEAAAVRLDMTRIQRIRSETNQVSALLSGIFAEEQPEPESPPAQVEAAADVEDDRFAGLDPTHAALLRELLERPEWPRGDFETLARSYDLLPDGALENLNEWAFDRLGDAVAEDGDPITIHASLIADGPTP